MAYEDADGRKWRVLVPPGETDGSLGIVQGPPDLSSLGLPPELSIALHNALYHRGLITEKDVRGKGSEIFAALQAVFRVDTTRILNLYKGA